MVKGPRRYAPHTIFGLTPSSDLSVSYWGFCSFTHLALSSSSERLLQEPANMYSQNISGQELIELAGKQSPLDVRDTLGNVLIGVCIALSILSTVAVSLRLFVRLHIQRNTRAWGWDDTLSVLSLVRLLATLILSSCHWRNL